MDIPLWSIRGSITVLEEIHQSRERVSQEAVPEGEPPGGFGSLWFSLAEMEPEKKKLPVAFCLLKGTLSAFGENKMFYGIGMMAQ